MAGATYGSCRLSRGAGEALPDLLIAALRLHAPRFETVTDSDFDSFRKPVSDEWSFFETQQRSPTSGETNSSTAFAR